MWWRWRLCSDPFNVCLTDLLFKKTLLYLLSSPSRASQSHHRRRFSSIVLFLCKFSSLWELERAVLRVKVLSCVLVGWWVDEWLVGFLVLWDILIPSSDLMIILLPPWYKFVVGYAKWNCGRFRRLRLILCIHTLVHLLLLSQFHYSKPNILQIWISRCCDGLLLRLRM